MPSTLADQIPVIERRHKCLQALTTAPQSKQELVEQLDMPRSTLDDAIRDLENAGLATYKNGKWQLTLLGLYTREHHTRYKEGLESLTEATSIINELPEDTPVDRRFLIEAETHVATSPVPDEVMQVFLDAVESATHIRGVTPVAIASYAEPFYRCVTTGDNYQLEVVLPDEVFNRLRDLHPDRTDEALTDDQTTLYYGDIPVTFSFWIGDDDHVGLIVYADQGVQGVLINDTDAAIEWATEQYDRIQENADPIYYRSSRVS